MPAETTDSNEQPQTKNRAFTIKSILFGIAGFTLISCYSGFNDTALVQHLMVGNHFPVGAYFFFLCLTFFWNLAWFKVIPNLVLRQRELVVVLCMTLIACWVPTSGLYRYFHKTLVLPEYYLPNIASAQQYNVSHYIPKHIVPTYNRDISPDADNTSKSPFGQIIHSLTNDPTNVYYFHPEEKEIVYFSFATGLSKGSARVPLSEMPWASWVMPLGYWWPMLIFFAAATIGLALLVHRQWVHHEQLSYPLASVASSLAEQDENGIAKIFKNKLFWWGLIPVLGIFAIHYLSIWFPGYFPAVSRYWDFGPGFWKLFPNVQKAGYFNVNRGSMFFTVVGLTYFISSEISLTMGLGQIILAFVATQFYIINGKPLAGQDIEVFRAGAYVGYALILMYTGRNFYGPVLLRAFGIGKIEKARDESVIAARIFLLSFLGFYLMLMAMGIDWLVALVYGIFVMLLFLVFTRIICETGAPFMQTSWWPSVALTKLLGPTAFGPVSLVVIYQIGSTLMCDPRECLMPYVSTGLKVADDAKIKRLRVLWVMLFAVISALILGFVVNFYSYYNLGALASDTYASKTVPERFLRQTAKHISVISETGQLEVSERAVGFEKLPLVNLDETGGSYFMIAIALVIAFSMIRFRFSKWPIHPLIFLVWGTYALQTLWPSFLIGWAIKELIVRFGGGKSYQNLKPLFIGMVLGELVAAGISIVVAYVYYSLTGGIPNALNILPR